MSNTVPYFVYFAVVAVFAVACIAIGAKNKDKDFKLTNWLIGSGVASLILVLFISALAISITTADQKKPMVTIVLFFGTVLAALASAGWAGYGIYEIAETPHKQQTGVVYHMSIAACVVSLFFVVSLPLLVYRDITNI